MFFRQLPALAATLLGALLTAAPLAAQPATPAPSAQSETPEAAADDGPIIDLAPEDRAPATPPEKQPAIAFGAGTAPDYELTRGLIKQRFREAETSSTNTSIGGYGEIYVNGLTRGKDGERNWQADVRRLVLFVAHSFTDDIRTYMELEVEHAFSCASCPGAVELEQAYIDWKLGGDKLGLRAGLILVPMGITNQWHEPPIFHGVVRPKVETVVIPSTWRELGAGIFGEPIEGLRYELYGMTGLNPLGIGAGGIGPGKQNGAFAAANAWALTGRVEYEPLLGVIVGASGYVSDAGSNAEFFTRTGEEADLTMPVIGWSADARWRRQGIEWKILFAEWHLPEALAMMNTYNAAGQRYFTDRRTPVPTRIRGGYVEGAVDVLHPFHLSHQLLPFARIETYDTQSAVPEGYEKNPTLSVREYTFGVSYRPIQQFVFKADYQLRNRKLGLDETQINFGIGYMY